MVCGYCTVCFLFDLDVNVMQVAQVVHRVQMSSTSAFAVAGSEGTSAALLDSIVKLQASMINSVS